MIPMFLLALQALLPARALEYVPLLVEAQRTHWPDAPAPWTLAGQVEQESCITLTHRRCWDPRAELKTAREYGVGFGQITVAYRPDGSVRFDTFAELRAKHAALADWTWDGRYDPARQLLAIVLMDAELFHHQRGSATLDDRLAFMLAAYNAGAAGLLKDRRYCAESPGCDPSRWFGHVELTSLKSKVPIPGYGRSPYVISRGYVRQILLIRRPKYQEFWRS